jgi:hypothetical protein
MWIFSDLTLVGTTPVGAKSKMLVRNQYLQFLKIEYI